MRTANAFPPKSPALAALPPTALLAAAGPPVEVAAAPRSPPILKKPSAENQLLQVRLGVASSLFAALRAKHADTAAHCLRVTLGCAGWALVLDFSEQQRDIIEVAALLHDIGKIGVPDSILLKPAALTCDEVAVMDQHRQIGVEILRSSCACPEILEIVATSPAWFDGTQREHKLAGSDIPLGARMLNIVDAFDAMTSDQVYRRAMSRERAFSELFRFAGTQFDPALVKTFAALHEIDQTRLHEMVARRWLEALSFGRVNEMWRLNTATLPPAEPTAEVMFQQKLLDNMRDAVTFVDTSLRIMLWNPGIERMTGIAASSIIQRPFLPSLLNLRDDDGCVIEDLECPVAESIRNGEQRMRRLTIRGRGKRPVSVEAHIVPVVGPEGAILGATVLMRDVSPEMSLEARCHSLHEMATKDPLTQVANRAEFNRVHQMFVAAHLERQFPCSLIIADLDHFKSVNDTYGHPAGDEVLKSFAKVLKSMCRTGDLVARYGGEEFVMLCADCDNATAVRRADEIRRALSSVPQTALASHNVTASFGVTEIQLGDTPATMLARADRALYDAKHRGRNCVVQLGSGIRGDEEESSLAAKNVNLNLLAEQHLVTAVPLGVAIEKLRGFVADHSAQVLSIDGGEVRLRIGRSGGLFFRRNSDRQLPFLIDLQFTEEKIGAEEEKFAGNSRTRIHIAVSPQRSRDRRKAEVIDRARELMGSFKAYLMASEELGAVTISPVQKKSKNLFATWLKRKTP